MKSIAQAYNTHNNEFEGRKCFYNEVNKCDHMIMMGRRMSAAVKSIKQEQTKHTMFLSCEYGKVQYIIGNLHLPTSWKSDKDLQDELEKITKKVAKMMAKGLANSTIIMGGDINADCNMIDHILKGEATTTAMRRATVAVEWLGSSGTSAQPRTTPTRKPRSTPGATKPAPRSATTPST